MVKFFSKNSNLCDHNSPTLQTDRQTTCDRNTALCTKVHRAVKTVTSQYTTVCAFTLCQKQESLRAVGHTVLADVINAETLTPNCTAAD